MRFSETDYHRSSSSVACDKELARLVEVAAPPPLPKKSRTFRGPERGTSKPGPLNLRCNDSEKVDRYIPSDSMHELRWHCVEGEEMVVIDCGARRK